MDGGLQCKLVSLPARKLGTMEALAHKTANGTPNPLANDDTTMTSEPLTPLQARLPAPFLP